MLSTAQLFREGLDWTHSSQFQATKFSIEQCLTDFGMQLQLILKDKVRHMKNFKSLLEQKPI